jgi:asparagine synthase (glutamine-hydrolysing)
MAKQHVTVALSGDAGDELFGGYSRYTMTDGLWHKLSKVPLGLRKLLGLGISAISTETLNSVLSLTTLASRYANIGDKLHKGVNVLGSKNISELYMGMVSHTRNPESWILNSHEPETLLIGSTSLFNGLNPIETMMALDMLTYLPNDILTKVDRAAMGVSLETRVPFLDHRVVEFAWSLPLEYKLRNGVGKWALREVLHKHVPKSLIDRPKMGFGVPLGEWLRGPLKDWAEALLEEKRLRDEGFFNVQLVRKKWEEHLSDRRNWQYQLWDVLMFQAWLDEQ